MQTSESHIFSGIFQLQVYGNGIAEGTFKAETHSIALYALQIIISTCTIRQRRKKFMLLESLGILCTGV